MKIRRLLFLSSVVGVVSVAFVGCGDDESPASSNDAGFDAFEASAPDTSVPDTSPPPADARSPEYTGSACAVAADCYGELDAAALKGAPVCIDKVTNGYCTHTCQTDADCCAVPGECRSGLKQVCASFENTTEKYCFLSCEDADINAAFDAGATDAGRTDAGNDADQYCRGNVSTAFGCRSTGGGSQNRKACLPTGGPNDGGTDADASDASDAPTDG